MLGIIGLSLGELRVLHDDPDPGAGTGLCPDGADAATPQRGRTLATSEHRVERGPYARGSGVLALWLALSALSAMSCGGTARDGQRRSDGATAAQDLRARSDDPAPRRPSKVYYVSRNGSDAHDGSRKRPWRTIAHAAARAGPGSLVHVRPGHYPGPIVLRRSGRPGRRITFAATTRWGAKISATSSGSLAVVQIDGDYVDVEGFDITGRGGDGTAGIAMQGSNQRAIANRVHDVVDRVAVVA